MDTFMDKLAHKLTAQEMIKANTAAEVEELNRLRNQVKEFDNCLLQMKQTNNELGVQVQKLVEDGVAKLEGARVDTAEIDRLVNESIAKIQEVYSLCGGMMGVMSLVSENVAKIQEDQTNPQQLQELKQVLSEKMEESGENIHKECVKVYRNVQAVVVEESGKQTEAVSSSVSGLKSKLNAILGVSVVALIAGLSGIVFQLLVYLHVI